MFFGGIPTLPIGALMTPASPNEMGRIEDWLREIVRQQGVMSESIGEVKGAVDAARDRVEGIAKIAHAANALAQRAVAHIEGRPLSEIVKAVDQPAEKPEGGRRPITLWDVVIFASGATVCYTVLGIAHMLASVPIK